ncbi:tropomyosin-1-like [Actinia tenebrosa]|uniref:Tropomyosin-1-like n=1 Tax=Actinia tenebrosa TaxID=6105 RepID=A0A6P8J928_ACTTE|nr:tropomyosin-1-like [Actinia tenebrosa]XP_031573411.1 tropomyosin-1-like [Actinia tenebrosa]
MEGLKRKVVQTRQEIEKAEIKEKYFRKLLRRQGERAIIAEMEADGLRNRIKDIEARIEKLNDKTYQVSLGVQAKSLENDDSEKDRKTMEGKEYDHSDQIALLEDRVADVVRDVDEKEIRLEEAKRRLTETKANLASANDRAEEADKKISILENEIHSMCKDLYTLERKAERRFKRNDYFADKVEELDLRRRNAILRADDSQIEGKQLQNQCDKVSNSLSREKKRVAFMKRELEDALADLNIARN